MDATFRRRKRAGILTDTDYQRMGLPTPTERQEKIRENRISRVFAYMGKQGLFDQGTFGVFHGIAGETDEMVVSGTWHDNVEWDENGNCIRTPTVESRLGAIFEKLNVDVVWYDEYLQCDCGKGFRVQPDCWTWRMYGWIGDGDYMCGDCLEETRCEECDGAFANDCMGYCHQHEDEPEGFRCHCECGVSEDED